MWSFSGQLERKFTCNQRAGKGVSIADILIILNGHNNFRNDIAQGKYVTKGLPEGKDFKEMVWDTGLAQAAQRVADSCLFQHQQIKDDRWKSVGQNLHIYMSTANTQGADWKGVLNAWIGEYKAYRFGQKITKQNGHLTQMMWSDTKFVGCGFTSFLSNDPKFKYKKLYVCNYGPGGNIVNRLPYRT
ncbi:unnamed protein product [Acanthoscelides obtectus]|uniref:SCP domain-containing protein n=1 Tax=Acanthoscelides obtectus TaxID=200917 RepID=A0A9P0KQK8_ACAOB|nr:unnamed protein product [Acanthoscelides obtectus]CAK1639618.1 hypothetical protein AOBTE_LOCUS11279 [Acanthoscelides obtectus]